MDILNQVTDRLSKDELRFVKFYLGNNGNAARKDEMLLDYVRKSGAGFNEDKIIGKLGYSTKDKNSYYRLKNRVLQDVGDGLNLLYSHKDDLCELHHYLSIYHIYYNKALFKPCLFYLRKAERLAKRIENYELLDNIYANFIRLSADIMEVDPEEYIIQREQNAALVDSLSRIDNMLATLNYRLKLTQNFGVADKQLLKDLQVQAKTISAKTGSGYGKQLQTRVYKAISQVYLQQHNYEALESYVKENLQRFEKAGWFNKDNHELKLQMLTYYANALHKNLKYKESLQQGELLGSELKLYGNLFYDKFLFFYYNIQIANYAVIDSARALKALNDFEAEMRKKKNYYYDVFIYLNRAGLLYDLGKHKEALKSLVRLYVNDSYRQADVAFKFKVEVSELIISYEAGDLESLEQRIPQVLKDYISLQSGPLYKRDFEIVRLIEKMMVIPNYRRDADIQKKIQALLKMKVNSTAEDSEIIKYRGWLQAKAI